MGIHQILSAYWYYYQWLIVAGIAYCVLLYFWRKYLPELFDIFETLIVGLWCFYTMLIISPIVLPADWGRIAVGLIVSAVPIVIFSLVSKGLHYRRLVKGIGNAEKE